MALSIITDSTSDITADLAKALGITVIPLTVFFGQQGYLDRAEMTTDEFYRRLTRQSAFPTTTQPAPAAFSEAYQKAFSKGDDVLAIVISSKLSGTYQSALSAIAVAGGEERVQVIDSLTTAMGLGLIVIAAAKLALKGFALDQVAKATREKIARSHVVMLFDTLRYLSKGGRIGKAQGLMGAMLAVKPILTVKDGIVHPLARMRTLAAGEDYLFNYVKGMPIIEELAVEHATTPDAADALIERLSGIYPKERIYRSTVSPVLGTYMGPNVISVSVLEGS
jgi:DegV family protein with EDD domain